MMQDPLGFLRRLSSDPSKCGTTANSQQPPPPTTHQAPSTTNTNTTTTICCAECHITDLQPTHTDSSVRAQSMLQRVTDARQTARKKPDLEARFVALRRPSMRLLRKLPDQRHSCGARHRAATAGRWLEALKSLITIVLAAQRQQE